MFVFCQLSWGSNIETSFDSFTGLGGVRPVKTVGWKPNTYSIQKQAPSSSTGPKEFLYTQALPPCRHPETWLALLGGCLGWAVAGETGDALGYGQGAKGHEPERAMGRLEVRTCFRALRWHSGLKFHLFLGSLELFQVKRGKINTLYSQDKNT